MEKHEPIYMAMLAGMAAVTTTLNGSFKLIETLVLARVLAHEAGAALWEEIKTDARRSVASHPALAEAVEALLVKSPPLRRP